MIRFKRYTPYHGGKQNDMLYLSYAPANKQKAKLSKQNLQQDPHKTFSMSLFLSIGFNGSIALRNIFNIFGWLLGFDWLLGFGITNLFNYGFL